MDRRDVEALLIAYCAAVIQMPQMVTEDTKEHDLLLLDHATEMRDTLQKLYEKRGQNKFTIPLKFSEARAIYQLWKYGFKLTPYARTIVQQFHNMIDKEHISSMWITEESETFKTKRI